MLHIGAGNVHLDHIHRGFRELFRHLSVFLRRVPGNIGDYNRFLLLEPGQVLLYKVVHAWILQADGV